MSASETHNTLAPELFKRIIRGTGSESEALAVLESVVLGVLKYYRPNPRHADEMLTALSMAVLERY